MELLFYDSCLLAFPRLVDGYDKLFDRDGIVMAMGGLEPPTSAL